MHVQADIVAQMVGEQDFHGVAGGVEAQLRQLVFEARFGDGVEFVEGDVGGGAAEGDAGALGREDGGVEVALGRGEAGGGGEGAGDVGDVVAVLGAGVDEDEGVWGEGGVVADVVDHSRVLCVDVSAVFNWRGVEQEVLHRQLRRVCRLMLRSLES